MEEEERQSVPFQEVLDRFRRDPLSLCCRVPGVWLVDKPKGPSSNLVVVRARKALGLRRIGHAGTLDPMADGLVVLLAGNATRLFDAMQEFPKTYRAGFVLGRRTDSRDATGVDMKEWAPEQLPPFSEKEIEEALTGFRGEVMQTPPMHSALKKNGQPLYKLARQGIEVEREPRRARVDSLELRDFDGAAGILEMCVSSGFYVRTLIDDLGLRLGAGGVMTSLTRTSIGPFLLENATAMEAMDGWKRNPPA